MRSERASYLESTDDHWQPWSLDTRYHRVEEGQRGPLVRRLEGYGNLLTWVMGAWQEGSKDLHELLEVLADNKVAVLGLARGR